MSVSTKLDNSVKGCLWNTRTSEQQAGHRIEREQCEYASEVKKSKLSDKK